MFKPRKTTKRVSAEKAKPIRALTLDAGTIPDPVEKVLLGVLFSFLLLLLIFHGSTEFGNWDKFAGGAVLVITLNYLFGSYFLRFQRETFRDMRCYVATLSLILFVLALARLTLFLEWWAPILIPVSFAGVILAIVFNRRFAMEVSGVILVYTGIILYGHDELLKVMVTLFSGAAAGILFATGIRKRSKLVSLGLLIGTVHVIVLASMSLFLGEIHSIKDVALDLSRGFIHGTAIGFLLTGLLPLVEYLLGTVTDMSLLELSNQNEHPLLRKLQIEAPGTHHHSFVVGMMAETAAEAIGANALLCRVGAYFHDIGKMNKPEYFIENSSDARVKHGLLNPEMSTLIITAHTKDGLELADYYGLPGPVRDFITEHHGTSAVEFFYREALARSDHGSKVDLDVFRYGGPRPRSMETAIVMLADSVEAALRSLEEPTPPRIQTMVHDVVMKKLTDGQLDDCLLTLRQLHRLEEIFFQVAVGISHKRPDISGNGKLPADSRGGEPAAGERPGRDSADRNGGRSNDSGAGPGGRRVRNA